MRVNCSLLKNLLSQSQMLVKIEDSNKISCIVWPLFTFMTKDMKVCEKVKIEKWNDSYEF